MTIADRRAKLEAERQRIMNTTTPEERVAMMEQFTERLREIGREYFPHATEEEAYGSDCRDGSCEN